MSIGKFYLYENTGTLIYYTMAAKNGDTDQKAARNNTFYV